MMLPIHQRFIEQAKKKISQDDRLTGLLAGGSMIHGAMDTYSDLDLVIVYDLAYRDEIMDQRIQLAETLGDLLSAFTGEHVGEPRLVICLYGPQLLHVDLKFVSNGHLPTGVRRLEQYAENEIDVLRETIPLHSYESCYHALKSTIRMYQNLRQVYDGFVRKEEAERASIEYLDTMYSSIRE